MTYDPNKRAIAGTYNAILTATVEVTVPVKVTDELLKQIATQFDVEVSELVHSDIEEYVTEEGFKDGPSSVCAQCSGWGSPWSLAVGDFEIFEDEPITFVE